jgi:SSS family transporter
VNLTAFDLVILVAYMTACLLIGIWSGRGTKTATDYMLGGRDVPAWAVLISIVATETSTVTFLSVPGFSWKHDLTFLQLPCGYILGRALVVLVLLPRFFDGEVVTAYDVLHRRFGGAVRKVASLLFLVTRSLADGLRLFLSAIVLQEVASIDLDVAIVATGAATIAYTFLGGMRAVIWTDVLQFFVYVGGALVAFDVLLDRLPGGLDDVLARHDKMAVFDLSFSLSSPYVLWAGLLGGAFVSFSSHGADQIMVQRYLCARSRGAAAFALLGSGVVVWLQFALFLLIGVGLYCYYQQQPPAEPFTKPDRVFAAFFVNEMPSGVRGIVLGAVFAAAMSTLSSSLNSCATSAVNDLLSPTRRLLWTKLLTIVFGCVQIAVGIAGQDLSNTVVEQVLAIAGFTTGIVLGVFFLGVWTRVGQRDALVGIAGGLVTVSLVAFQGAAWFPLQVLPAAIAWPWYPLVGSFATLGFGLLAQRLLR